MKMIQTEISHKNQKVINILVKSSDGTVVSMEDVFLSQNEGLAIKNEQEIIKFLCEQNIPRWNDNEQSGGIFTQTLLIKDAKTTEIMELPGKVATPLLPNDQVQIESATLKSENLRFDVRAPFIGKSYTHFDRNESINRLKLKSLNKTEIGCNKIETAQSTTSTNVKSGLNYAQRIKRLRTGIQNSEARWTKNDMLPTSEIHKSIDEIHINNQADDMMIKNTSMQEISKPDNETKLNKLDLITERLIKRSLEHQNNSPAAPAMNQLNLLPAGMTVTPRLLSEALQPKILKDTKVLEPNICHFASKEALVQQKPKHGYDKAVKLENR